MFDLDGVFEGIRIWSQTPVNDSFNVPWGVVVIFIVVVLYLSNKNKRGCW